MEQPAVLSTTNLCYQYSKESQTLFDINMQVARGTIYGFLGPNGSGKTTTLSLLLGLLEPTSGDIRIFEKDISKERIAILRRTGSLIESPSLYGHLSARENLEVYRRIHGVSKQRIDEVLDIVKLSDTDSKTVKRFSLGMKQRLAIALALLPDPELLILDEPTNGLDPAGIIELRGLLISLNKDCGMTVIISSHLLTEVEKIASCIGIIYKGRLLFQGSPEGLKQHQRKSTRLLINTSNNESAIKLLAGSSAEIAEENICVAVSDVKEAAAINRALVAAGIDVYSIKPVEADLEQLFMALTTESL